MDNDFIIKCFLIYVEEENKKIKVIKNNIENYYINTTYNYNDNFIMIYEDSIEVLKIKISDIKDVYEFQNGDILIICLKNDQILKLEIQN